LYASIAHKKSIIESYFNALDGVFLDLSKCERGDENIFDLLENQVSDIGFKRLN
jgi:hypothetical protein